jgi:hypothetical protein
VVDSVKTLESEDDTQFIQDTGCIVGNPSFTEAMSGLRVNRVLTSI